jgi:hypothetical protein
MEATRCLKRRLSDIVYRHMVDAAARAVTGVLTQRGAMSGHFGPSSVDLSRSRARLFAAARPLRGLARTPREKPSKFGAR